MMRQFVVVLLAAAAAEVASFCNTFGCASLDRCRTADGLQAFKSVEGTVVDASEKAQRALLTARLEMEARQRREQTEMSAQAAEIEASFTDLGVQVQWLEAEALAEVRQAKQAQAAELMQTARRQQAAHDTHQARTAKQAEATRVMQTVRRHEAAQAVYAQRMAKQAEAAAAMQAVRRQDAAETEYAQRVAKQTQAATLVRNAQRQAQAEAQLGKRVAKQAQAETWMTNVRRQATALAEYQSRVTKQAEATSLVQTARRKVDAQATQATRAAKQAEAAQIMAASVGPSSINSSATADSNEMKVSVTWEEARLAAQADQGARQAKQAMAVRMTGAITQRLAAEERAALATKSAGEAEAARAAAEAEATRLRKEAGEALRLAEVARMAEAARLREMRQKTPQLYTMTTTNTDDEATATQDKETFQKQPLSEKEEAARAAYYAGIEDVGERAYQILVDLNFVETEGSGI